MHSLLQISHGIDIMYSINIPFVKSIIMQIYEGEITDWNWVKRYGFATLENGNDVFVMTSQCLEVKKEGAENFRFNGRPVKDCCKGRVWFDLYEKIWLTLSPEHPNVAVNISFTNNGHLTRLIAAGEALPYSEAERKRLGLAGLVLPDRRAIVDIDGGIVDIDDELDRREGPSYASDSTDDEEDDGRRVREVQTPAKKPPPRTPAKPPAKRQAKSPHVGIPPSPDS
eukprot:g2647.t1